MLEEIKRDLWAVDAETDPFKKKRLPKAFLWGAYNLRTGEFLSWSQWDCKDPTKEFMKWASRQNAILWAHNGGKFDWHLGPSEYMDKEKPITIIGGRLAKFTVNNCEFRDSWNILPGKLAKIGDKLDIDISKLERSVRNRHRKEIERYHKQDCVALAQAITAFLERHGLRLTQAGAAMSYWESITGEKADRTDKRFYDRFYPYYFGGRVECFQPGIIERPFTAIDINSAYPFAMLSSHPTGKRYEQGKKLPTCESELSRCFIQLMAKSTGAFPKRRDDGSLWFPSDGLIRQFHITGWEYLAAKETGTLEMPVIGKVIRFNNSTHFKDYVIPLYNERKKHKENEDDIQSNLVKLLLNSLYGKFASDYSRYKEYKIVPNQSVLDYVKMGWKPDGNHDRENMYVSAPLPEVQQRFYNVATAASITGYVRAMLWRVIARSSGVLYCDTDCVMAETIAGAHFDKLALGAWDTDLNGTYGAFAGKKLYAINGTVKSENKWKVASKGVKLTKEQIIRVAKGETVRYERDAPTFKRTVQKRTGQKHTWTDRNVKRTDIK